ncbi:MAG: TIGR03936 family radical SAM-associated protein [Lachnospiraceae bacterium]
MRVRIKFSKHGVVKFIGHLDIMRYFQKAIRRAEIDIAYSEGFSPHQIMSFAAPLSVGYCSNGEYMDIQLNSHRGRQDLLDRLNAAMVDGIRVLNAVALPDTAGNAMASVAAAAYTIEWKSGYKPLANLKEVTAAFMNRESIPVIKQTKKSQLSLDLKPGIYRLEAVDDDSLYILVDASSKGNIKPALLLEALFTFAGEAFNPLAVQITREETYTNKGRDNSELVPLDGVGEAF